MSTYNSFKHSPDCSFKTFWLGFTDWWAEQCLSPEQRSTHRQTLPQASKKLQWILLAALVLGAPALAAVLAPLAADTLSVAGTHVVARSAEVLAIAIGLLFVVGLPLWAALKIRRFCRDMCERGHDILDGTRVHARYL